MMTLQLDLFRTHEECELIELRKQIEALKNSQDKVRKKLFAENGKLRGGFEDLSNRLEIIEKAICKG